MSRLPVISTLLFIVLFIANTVFSAPQEIFSTSQVTRSRLSRSSPGEFPETRETELLEHKRQMMKENITREDEIKRNETMHDRGSEVKDLIESHVTPRDDDDTVLEKKKTKINPTKDNLPPVVFPDDDRVKNINNADPAIMNTFVKLMGHQGGNNTIIKHLEEQIPLYKIIPKPNPPTAPRKTKKSETTTLMTTTLASLESAGKPKPKESANTTEEAKHEITSKPIEPKPTTEATITMESSKPEESSKPTESTNPTETTKSAESTMPTTLMAVIEGRTTSTMSPAEAMLHTKKEPKRESMPTGIVVLITAISFSIVSIVAYIGLIVRKRYFEWRHGNRELLVNDFDATDISNFEADIYHDNYHKYP